MSEIVVLVVDDEVPALNAMSRMLTSDRYQIVTARTGSEALDILRGLLGGSIKLLLLDLSLTDMSGLTLAEQAKEIVPDAKVLFVSGYEPSEELADRWIEKPFDVEDLRQRISEELFGG